MSKYQSSRLYPTTKPCNTSNNYRHLRALCRNHGIAKINIIQTDHEKCTVTDVYKDNVIAFAWKLSTGYTFLGMYTTEEAAHEAIEVIRTLFRDEDGKTLL